MYIIVDDIDFRNYIVVLKIKTIKIIWAKVIKSNFEKCTFVLGTSKMNLQSQSPEFENRM